MKKYFFIARACSLLFFSLLLLGCGGELDTIPPVVSITFPTNNQEVSGTVTITATASDNSGRITKVEFFVEGRKIGEDTTPPFSINWVTFPPHPSVVVLFARAWDPSGNVATSAGIWVIKFREPVAPPLPPDPTPPDFTIPEVPIPPEPEPPPGGWGGEG